MNKILLIAVVYLGSAFVVSAGEPFREIDSLIEQNKLDQARSLLENDSLSEVGVVLRKAFILIQEVNQNFNSDKADKEEREKIKQVFEKAMEMVEEAFLIDNALKDPEAHKLYYGRAMARSMIGSAEKSMSFLKEIDYIMSDLEEALKIEPEYIDAAMFAAGMYQYLPGWPISQGDKEKAISFLRYALEILEKTGSEMPEKRNRTLNAYIKLALSELLADRNWSANKRVKKIAKIKEDYSKAETFFKQLGFYEAKVTVSFMSDREESRLLYNSIGHYFSDQSVLAELSETQKEQLDERLEKLEKHID